MSHPRRRIAAVFGMLLLALGVAFYASSAGLASFGSRPSGARLLRMKQSPRYRGGAFQNEEPTAVMVSGLWRTAREFHEYEWGQDAALAEGVKIVSVPARHFSGRGLTRNGTLWTSWVLRARSRHTRRS